MQPHSIPLVKENEYLPPLSSWLHLGGWLLAGTVGLLFVATALVRYNRVVITTAIARPTGDLRLIQSQSEGVISQVLVKEGEPVAAQGKVVLLDDAKLRLEIERLRENLKNRQFQLIQLNRELEALEKRIRAESEFLSHTLSTAEGDLERAFYEYRDRLTIAQSDFSAAEAAYEIAKDEADRYEKLASEGIISTLQLKEKKAVLKSALARLKQTQALSHPPQISLTIASERIAQERARKSVVLANLEQEQASFQQRKIDLQIQIAQEETLYEQALSELKKTQITSPIQGVLVNLKIRNPGQTVKIGEIIAQVAPIATPLVFKARVSPSNIGLIQTGQVVQLRVSAYPYPDYGILPGVVDRIAVDTTSDVVVAAPGSPISGSYEITIRPEQQYIGTLAQQYPLKAGMEARADIITREDTVLQWIFRRIRLLTKF